MKSVFGGRYRKSDFFLIFYRKRQWGTSGDSWVIGGGGSPILSKLSKKSVKKSEKAAKSEKNQIFFLLKMD